VVPETSNPRLLAALPLPG